MAARVKSYDPKGAIINICQKRGLTPPSFDGTIQTSAVGLDGVRKTLARPLHKATCNFYGRIFSSGETDYFSRKAAERHVALLLLTAFDDGWVPNSSARVKAPVLGNAKGLAAGFDIATFRSLTAPPSFAAFLIVLTTGCVCYLTSLPPVFTYPDLSATLLNADVNGTATLATLFAHNLWGLDNNHYCSIYRPATAFSLRMNFAVGSTPMMYHLTNVLLHGLTASSLTLLPWAASASTVVPSLFDRAVPAATRQSVGFLTGLLFAVHPLHTVASAPFLLQGRSAMLCTLTLVLSVVCYLRSLSGHTTAQSAKGTAYDRCGVAWIAAALLFGAASALSSEEGEVALWALVALDVSRLSSRHQRPPAAEQQSPGQPSEESDSTPTLATQQLQHLRSCLLCRPCRKSANRRRKYVFFPARATMAAAVAVAVSLARLTLYGVTPPSLLALVSPVALLAVAPRALAASGLSALWPSPPLLQAVLDPNTPLTINTDAAVNGTQTMVPVSRTSTLWNSMSVLSVFGALVATVAWRAGLSKGRTPLQQLQHSVTRVLKTRWATCCVTLWLGALILGAPARGCTKLLPLGGVGGWYLMLVGVCGLLAQFAPSLLEATGVLPLSRRVLVDGFGFWKYYRTLKPETGRHVRRGRPPLAVRAWQSFAHWFSTRVLTKAHVNVAVLALVPLTWLCITMTQSSSWSSLAGSSTRRWLATQSAVVPSDCAHLLRLRHAQAWLALEQRDRPDAALSEFVSVLGTCAPHTQEASAVHGMGLAFKKMGQLPHAIQTLRIAAEAAPKNFVVQLDLAKILLMPLDLGPGQLDPTHLQEAVRVLESATALLTTTNAQHAEATYYLALAQVAIAAQHISRKGTTQRQVRLALRPAHDTLSKLLGVEVAEEQARSPSELEAQYLLGVVASAQGDVEEGRRRYLLVNRSSSSALSERVRSTLTHLQTHGVPKHINETRRAVLSFVVPRGEARAGWSPRAVSLMDDQLSGPRGVWQRVEMRKTSKGDCAIARVDGVYVSASNHASKFLSDVDILKVLDQCRNSNRKEFTVWLDHRMIFSIDVNGAKHPLKLGLEDDPVVVAEVGCRVYAPNERFAGCSEALLRSLPKTMRTQRANRWSTHTPGWKHVAHRKALKALCAQLWLGRRQCRWLGSGFARSALGLRRRGVSSTDTRFVVRWVEVHRDLSKATGYEATKAVMDRMLFPFAGDFNLQAIDMYDGNDIQVEKSWVWLSVEDLHGVLQTSPPLY